MANSNSSSGGIGTFTVLFLIFLILKLTGNIDWSWWWVTCPLWGSAALGLVALIIFGAFFVGFSSLYYMFLRSFGIKTKKKS